MWMTTFWMGYSMSVKPFEDPAINILEVVNELFYNLNLFLCFTFTSFLPDLGTRDYTGYVFIVLILTQLVINIGVQLKDSMKNIALRLKKLKMLYKQKQLKWRKPDEKIQYLPHSKRIKEIVHQDYRKRVIDDVVSEVKQKIGINKPESVQTTVQNSLSTEVNFIKAKTKGNPKNQTKKVKPKTKQTKQLKRSNVEQ